MKRFLLPWNLLSWDGSVWAVVSSNLRARSHVCALALIPASMAQLVLAMRLYTFVF